MNKKMMMLASATAISLASLAMGSAAQAFTVVTPSSDQCGNSNRGFRLGCLANEGVSLKVGDKQFSDFFAALTRTDRSGAATTPDRLNDIRVFGLGEDGLGYGLRFVGPISADNPRGQDISAIDLFVEFTATVLDPLKLISSIDLSFNGAHRRDGSSASIMEQALDPETNDILGVALVRSNRRLEDSIVLDNALKSVKVNKDVLVRASVRGSAEISYFDQRFEQVAIPTPALLPGLIGMGVAALRKRDQEGAEDAEA
jgi:hypothetical protein